MKKVLSLIIAVLICISSAMIVSAETEVPKITDLVSPEQVSGLENIDVISTASNEETIVVLTKDNNDKYYLNYSTDGVDYSKVDIVEKLSVYVSDEGYEISYDIDSVQLIDDEFIVFGRFENTDIWHCRYFIFKTESAENVLYDYVEIENSEMGGDYHRGQDPHIKKVNDKYVYYFEKFEAYTDTEYVLVDGTYRAKETNYCPYFISDDLKKWKKYETPSFTCWGYNGTGFFEMDVSEKGILVLGYLSWIGSDLNVPSIKVFCKTSDFENYLDLDMSIFNNYNDAPYTFKYYKTVLGNGDIALMYKSGHLTETEEGYMDFPVVNKYYDCFVIDMNKGTVKKIISVENENGIGWLCNNIYPAMSIVTFTDDAILNVYNYNCETSDVTITDLDNENFRKSKQELSEGKFDFWDKAEDYTFVIGYTAEDESIVSVVNHNYSKVHLFSVTQTESLFIWNEKDIAYFYSDDDCIAVSLTELMDKLNGNDSSDPDDTPAFKAICPDCGKEFTDEAEYNKHTENHNNNNYEPPVLDKVFKVNKPTTSTVNYGDTLILHANISEVPEGCSIVWSVEGTGVELSPSADGTTCAVTCTGSGGVAVKATVVDENGNVITDSEGNECSSAQILTAKASFFQKLISFFKNLFGMVRIIPQLLKTAF